MRYAIVDGEIVVEIFDGVDKSELEQRYEDAQVIESSEEVSRGFIYRDNEFWNPGDLFTEPKIIPSIEDLKNRLIRERDRLEDEFSSQWGEQLRNNLFPAIQQEIEELEKNKLNIDPSEVPILEGMAQVLIENVSTPPIKAELEQAAAIVQENMKEMGAFSMRLTIVLRTLVLELEQLTDQEKTEYDAANRFSEALGQK